MNETAIKEHEIDKTELIDGMGIYCIECIKTSKVYIGQSINICKRVKSHEINLLKNTHINNKLQNAFNKYGAHEFKVFTLEILSDSTCLTEREHYWANVYKVFENGFNIAPIEKFDDNWRINKRDAEHRNNYKLNENDVVTICDMYKNGERIGQLAKTFNVHKSTISNITREKTWRYIAKSQLQGVGIAECKLSKNTIIDICELLNEGIQMKIIASQFKVSLTTIKNIKYGRIQKDVSSQILIKDRSTVIHILNELQVIKICHMLNKQMPMSDIATDFNVSIATIQQIKSGKTWKSISREILIQSKLVKRNGLNKLKVIEICKLLNEGCPIDSIAKSYNVTLSTIHAVKERKRWRKASEGILLER